MIRHTPETNQHLSAVSDELKASGDDFNDTTRYLRAAKLARKLELERNDARIEAGKFRNMIQDCKWPKHRFSWELR